MQRTRQAGIWSRALVFRKWVRGVIMTNRIETRTYAERGEYFRKYNRQHPRPEHTPIGDPCAECGLDAKYHRKRSRGYRPQQGSRPYKYKKRACVGVDGEGFESGSVSGYVAF